MWYWFIDVGYTPIIPKYQIVLNMSRSILGACIKGTGGFVAQSRKVCISVEYTGDFKYLNKHYNTLVIFSDGSTNIVHDEVDLEVDDEPLDEVLESHRRRYFSNKYTYEKID